jgi:subtilisin
MFRKVACVVVFIAGAVSVPATAVWANRPDPTIPVPQPGQSPSDGNRPPQAGPQPTNDYIVVLRDSVPDPAAVAAEQGRTHGFQASFVYTHALKGFAASIPDAAITVIQQNPRVLFVAADREVRVSPSVCTDLTTCQRTSVGVERIGGDVSSTKSGDGKGLVNVNVAVVDSGVGPHPDLNVAGGVDCTRRAGTPGGTFDDVAGHGTFVGGFIGALDNGFGRVGVAPAPTCGRSGCSAKVV